MYDDYIPNILSVKEIVVNELFEYENKEIQLFIDEKEDEYTVMLVGKLGDQDFNIDATIALEKHASGTHTNHHLNLESSDSEDFLFKGKVHFNFFVSSKEELDNAVKGFAYSTFKALEFLHEDLRLPLDFNLGLHFFGEGIYDFEPFETDLHNLVKRSIEKKTFELSGEIRESIEFKTKLETISSDSNIHRKLFHLARVLIDERFFQPYIGKPVYEQIALLPEIKKLGLSIGEVQSNLTYLMKQGENIHQLTPQKFSKKLTK